MTKTKLVAAVASSTLLAIGLQAGTASAATSVVDSGNTTVKFNGATAKTLKSLRIKVSATGKASSGSAGVRFPATGGKINPKTGAGSITHTGGLKFSSGSKKLLLSNPRVSVAKSSGISATVSGKKVAIFKIDTKKIRIKKSGSRVSITKLSLRLSAQGAKALNSAFKAKAFKKAQSVAAARSSLKTMGAGKSVALNSGSTALTLQPTTAAAFTSLGITLTAVAPTTQDTTGAFVFPITSGKVNDSTLAGAVNHSGGITLSTSYASMRMKDFIVSTGGKTPSLSADVEGLRVTIADVDLSNATKTVTPTSVTITGAKLTVSSIAATALNATFKTSIFSTKTVLGTATLTGSS